MKVESAPAGWSQAVPGCDVFCAEGSALRALGGDSSRIIVTQAYVVERANGVLAGRCRT